MKTQQVGRFPLWLFVMLPSFSFALPATTTYADLSLDANCVQQTPADVLIGQAVTVVTTDGTSALQFQREGITVPLAHALSAESGTVQLRVCLPAKWPSANRTTLFHIGEQAHVHITLFFQDGHLNAVYKAGQPHYATIRFRESAHWLASSWHNVTFGWQADGQTVNFSLEADNQLVGRQSGHLIDQWPAQGYIGARRRGQTWQGLIQRVALSERFTPPRELRPGRRSVVIDGNCVEGVCYSFWSINNYTNQHMFANPGYAERAKPEKPFMKSVNCVRLLGGRNDGRNVWFQGVGSDGRVNCDFTGLIQYLQGIQDAGYTPRIVLDNIPTAMSEPGELAKYGNTRPASDLKIWHNYVCQAVQAMVEAFGSETVSEWRFRVGTEPDLNPGHWQGTKIEYLCHYDCTVDAVCSVIDDVEIGPGNILNPAHADRVNGVGQKPWGLDIVDHCAVGTNTWTGEVGTRICFLECSWYGQVGRSIDSLDVAIGRMRNRLKRYPQFADLPISIAEFAILQDEHGRRLYGGDITEWGASWYAAVASHIYDLDVCQVHEWAQTTVGIPHPRTNVIGMLNQMEGGQRLKVTVDSESAARAGALSCYKNDRFYILLYNHRPWRNPSIPEQIDLTLRSDRLGQGDTWIVSQWGIDREHGVFAYQLYDDCREAGLEPLPASPIYGGNPALRFGPQVRSLIAQNRMAYLGLAAPGTLGQQQPLATDQNAANLTIQMPGHSVRLLVISRN